MNQNERFTCNNSKINILKTSGMLRYSSIGMKVIFNGQGDDSTL